MADYHVGSGQTYATIADALVDIVALGSTQWTEDTRIVLHTGTYAEALDYGTTYGWDLGSTAEFPLTYTVNDGDTVEVTGSGGTYAGQNYMGNIRFENINFTGGGVLNLTKYGGQITFENCSMSLNGYCYIYPNSYPNGGAVIFTDCDIHHTGLYQIILSSTNSSFIFNRCKISSDNQVSLFYAPNNTAIKITNSRFYNINVAHGNDPSSVNILHSTFNGASRALLECEIGYGYIKNCIFANLPAIFTTAGGESIPKENVTMDGNVYDTVTAFATGTTAIADLTAAKVAGIEGDNSVNQSVTFQSSDYTNENFLKISESISNAKTAGVNEDAFGTARERYDNIDAGAHQYAAAFTPDNDDVITSAGGNYDDTNLIPSNVKNGIDYGIDETGTYDNATDPDYVLSSQGGNYIDTNLIPANVKLDVEYGVGEVGTYDPSGEPPTQPTLSLKDDGDGSTVIATVSGSDTGTTNTIYTAPYGSTAWTEQGSRTDDGDVTLTLDSGSYWAYCDSSLESCSSRSNISIVHVSDIDNAAIVDIAEYIKDEINNSEISNVAERNYIQHERMEKISGTEVWVQPNEHRIERANRRQDQHEYDIDVSIFKRCKTTAETDELVLLSEQVYELLRTLEINGSTPMLVTIPTMFSPDDLIERNLFAAVITVTVKDIL